MRHTRINTPAYVLWIEARPTRRGKGKDVYYDAVKKAAREVIHLPIPSPDIEVEIVYSTTEQQAERMDTDNVNKPTLDALEGVAYDDDSQVRHVESALFDRATVKQVDGRVEHLQRLFYTSQPHVVLIQIFSDSRLLELGGAAVVEQRRLEEFNRDFEALTRPSVSADGSLRPAQVTPGALSGDETRADRIISRLKNHHLLAPIIAIGIVIAGVAGVVAAGYVKNFWEKPSPPRVFAECQMGVMPSIMPAEGHIYMLQTYERPADEGGGLEDFFGAPGSQRAFKNEDGLPAWAYRCQLTNYSEEVEGLATLDYVGIVDGQLETLAIVDTSLSAALDVMDPSRPSACYRLGRAPRMSASNNDFC